MSSSRGNLDCTRCLVESKTDVDEQDKWGNTALHLAIRRHYSQVAMLLLHTGADFDLVNCVSGHPASDLSNFLELHFNNVRRTFLFSPVTLPFISHAVRVSSALLSPFVLSDASSTQQMSTGNIPCIW